jgi:hypothetical protein
MAGARARPPGRPSRHPDPEPAAGPGVDAPAKERTFHLRTVAWVVERFLPVRIALEDGRPGRVRIVPAA